MLTHWTVHYVTTLISFYFVFFDFPTFFHLDHLWHFHAEVLPTSLSVFFSFTAQIQSAPMKQSVILASGCCYTSNFRELAETTMGAVYSMLPSLELERKKSLLSVKAVYVSGKKWTPSGNFHLSHNFSLVFYLSSFFPRGAHSEGHC